MKTISEQIKHGMALAFFACAYAEQADECGQSLSGQIMYQLPVDIDKAALHAADTLAIDLVRTNGVTSIDPNAPPLQCLYMKAAHMSADGADHELTPELFGHYLAMQAMGTGVGLESFGYAVSDAIAVPYCEFGSHSLERDYFEGADDE